MISKMLRKDLIYGGKVLSDINPSPCLSVLQKGLKDNFADVQVSVVDCPDLTKEPFTFPVKGKQFLQFTFFRPNLILKPELL